MGDDSEDEGGLFAELRTSWRVLAGAIALLWLVEVADTIVGGALDQFGISLPTENAVSWEGNLAGMLAGIGVAAIVGRRERLRERD